ncbi:MAG: tRNA 4-thiouridine(8) synthase ThiI, partial [Thermoprotei archaeon]
PKLHIVDFRPIVSDIIKNVKKELRQVILRRAMYRAAEIIAREVQASAIVTGESLGQVSSQTLWNIAVAEEIVRIPILRPLIGLDKEEIINLARKIGTYELSSKVREYCAIARGKVATRAKLSDVKMEEKKISSDVIEDAAKKREIYNVFEINPIDFLPVENVAINFIPSEALLIDLREREDFEKWHPPNAIHIEDLKIDSLPKDRVIIAYCDSGILSSEFAASLRKKGFKAFSFEGGLSQLRYNACK